MTETRAPANAVAPIAPGDRTDYSDSGGWGLVRSEEIAELCASVLEGRYPLGATVEEIGEVIKWASDILMNSVLLEAVLSGRLFADWNKRDGIVLRLKPERVALASPSSATKSVTKPAKAPKTPTEVEAMRERYAQGDIATAVLASQNGLSQAGANGIVRGDLHRDAGGPIAPPRFPLPPLPTVAEVLSSAHLEKHCVDCGGVTAGVLSCMICGKGRL